jgi:hypothetical protein
MQHACAAVARGFIQEEVDYFFLEEEEDDGDVESGCRALKSTLCVLPDLKQCNPQGVRGQPR